MVLMTVMVAGACSRVQEEPGPSYPEEISFRTIAKDQNSGVEDQKQVVIDNQEEYEDILGDITLEGLDTSDIDFEEEMVIAVFYGLKNTAGYEITIDKILEYEDKLVVEVSKKEPSEDEMTAQVITTPFHMVRLEKIMKMIDFLDKQ